MIRLATKSLSALSRTHIRTTRSFPTSITIFCGKRALSSTAIPSSKASSIRILCPSTDGNVSTMVDDLGKKYYQLAKEHIAKHEQNQEQEEEAKRSEQYRSKSQDGSGSGIQVIKTIVKQNRRDTSRRKVNEEESTNNEVLESDLEKAQECMQLSAFVHGYNDAIVSLANHALSKSSNFNAEKEFRYIMGNENLKNGNFLDTIRDCESGADVAMILYQLAGENGSKEGWFNLGHLLWTGHNPKDSGSETALTGSIVGRIEPDIQLSLECFEKAVRLNDDDARYFLAVHYISGGECANDCKDGLAEDEEEECRMRGLRLVQEAGDNGHAGALYYLALLHRNGDSTIEVKPCLRLFREYLDEAVEEGDSDALFLKAHCQFHGEDGYDLDLCAALDGFMMAGDAGNADGYVSAGAMLHRGLTTKIEQDQRRAFELYQQAGEMGNIDGWKNVIACYMAGEGVPQCEQTAKYIAKTMLNEEVG